MSNRKNYLKSLAASIKELIDGREADDSELLNTTELDKQFCQTHQEHALLEAIYHGRYIDAQHIISSGLIIKSPEFAQQCKQFLKFCDNEELQQLIEFFLKKYGY